jgi:hypothetical protein
LQNLRNYNLKSSIYIFSAVWKAVNNQTLENGWRKLLNNMDTDLQLEGFEVSDFHRTIWNVGETEVTEDAVLQWLGEDVGDPRYQVMAEREIAEEVMARDKTDEESGDDDEEEFENQAV